VVLKVARVGYPSTVAGATQLVRHSDEYLARLWRITIHGTLNSGFGMATFGCAFLDHFT